MNELKLTCPKCKSRNTEIKMVKDMVEKTGDKSFISNKSGVTKVSNGEILVVTLRVIINLLKWLTVKEENNKKLLICKDCGYWEKL